VYIIDFGLSRMYRAPNTHLHIPYNENRLPTGTTAYSSINNHLGVERSRRDDMESLAYVLLYFLHGSLPWLGVEPVTDHQWRDTILGQKMSSPPSFPGPVCPAEFNVFLNYCRNLRFDEKPDYAYAHKLFRKPLIREGHQHGRLFAQPTACDILIARRAGAKARGDKQGVQVEKDTGHNRVLRSHSRHHSSAPSAEKLLGDPLLAAYSLILAT